MLTKPKSAKATEAVRLKNAATNLLVAKFPVFADSRDELYELFRFVSHQIHGVERSGYAMEILRGVIWLSSDESLNETLAEVAKTHPIGIEDQASFVEGMRTAFSTMAGLVELSVKNTIVITKDKIGFTKLPDYEEASASRAMNEADVTKEEYELLSRVDKSQPTN